MTMNGPILSYRTPDRRTPWARIWPQTWLGMLSAVLLVAVLVLSEIRWQSVGDVFVEGGRQRFYRGYVLKDLIILCAAGAASAVLSVFEWRKRHQLGLLALPFHLLLLSEYYNTQQGDLNVNRIMWKAGLAMIGFPLALLLVCGLCLVRRSRKLRRERNG